MAQTIIPLYTQVPGSKPAPNAQYSETDAAGIVRVSRVSIPVMEYYPPVKKADKPAPAVIICPGGGYKILAASHEGSDVAKVLNTWGIAAFVLYYRLPDDSTCTDKATAPLQDAQRAMQIVREQAKQWNINAHNIGVMGFSAGGHLAASLSTRYTEVLVNNPRNTSLRPDFSVLAYPVISFTDSLTHKGSRENLLGKKPTQAKIQQYSNELQVNKNTPPAFLVHAKDDNVVPFANSEVYLKALQHFNIPALLFTYEKGGHGFGMKNARDSRRWMDALKTWLHTIKVI